MSLSLEQKLELFRAGWRPALGWVCVLLLVWYSVAPVWGHKLDTVTFVGLVVAVLGSVGARSYDKRTDNHSG